MPVVVRWLLALVPTNPIVVRLVQGGSRRLRHMYIRSLYLAVLIVALLGILLTEQSGVTNFRDLAANGARAFEIVAYLQIGLICVLAPVFMAGAIAQESNPRTWEILLTTPLSAPQIVLGTLFGRLFFVLALLVASLPLFAITQYFGGVPGASVFLSYVVSGTAAILVGAVAVALAVNRLAGRRAVFTFYVAVVTYLGVTFAADSWLTTPWGGVTVMTPLNPFLALRALLNPSGYPTPDEVDLQTLGALSAFWFGRPVLAWIVVSAGTSLALIAMSTLTVRAVGTKVGGAPWYRRALGLGARGSTTRPARHVWHNPVAWRECAARAATLPKILARWGFMLAGWLWGIGCIAAFHEGVFAPDRFRLLLLATVWTELAVIILVAINMSATAISREREDGTLDLILTTPITPGAYLGGKLKGLIAFLMPLLAVPLGTVLLASGYILMDGFGRTGGVTVPTVFGTTMVDVPVLQPLAGLVMPLTVIPFVAFCVMIGLQWSLRTRGTLGSVVGTVAVVGAIAGTAGLCGWSAASSIPFIGPALTALSPGAALFALADPGAAFSGVVDDADDLGAAFVAVAIGSVGAVVVYATAVVSMRASMVRTFDAATRRLAGER